MDAWKNTLLRNTLQHEFYPKPKMNCFNRICMVGVVGLILGIMFGGCLIDAKSVKEEKPASYYVEMGQNLVGQERYQEAIDKYTKSLEVWGKNGEKEEGKVRVFLKRSELYQLVHQYDFAREDLERIIRLEPNRNGVWDKLIRLRVKTGKIKEANQDVSKVRDKSLKRKVNEAYSLFRQYEQSTGDPEKCVSSLSKLLVQHVSDNVDLRVALASCALKVKNFKLCQNELKAILKADPNNANALGVYGEYLYRRGATNEAMKNLKNCLQSSPDNKYCMTPYKEIKKAERLFLRAEVKYDEKKYAEAVNKYKHYLSQIDNPPNYSEVLLKICNIYLKLRDPENGIPECNLAVQETESEERIEALLTRAELHFLEEDGLDAAEQDLRKARDDSQQRVPDRLRKLEQKLQRLRKMASRKDYYKILEVPKSASKKEIRKAYRKMAAKWHPDVFHSKPAEEKKKAEKRMIDVSEAYEVLSDDDKRARFDAGEDVNDPHNRGGNGGGFHQQHFNFPDGFGFGGQQQGGFRFNFGF